MSKLSEASSRATEALRKLDAYDLPFTGKAFAGAIAGRVLEEVRAFIEAGIDVNEAVEGMLPIVLLASTRPGNCEIAQLLIDNGADVNAVFGDGVTALRMAIFNRNKDLVRLLIANGADVNAIDKYGDTAIAAARGNTEMVQFLIENGADVKSELASSSQVSEKQDITTMVERLELLEEKRGIEISGVYATCCDRPNAMPPDYDVMINFDVTSLNGGQLEANFQVQASAYNAAGQLLATAYAFIYSDKFMGFGSWSEHLYLDQAPKRIRLFPTQL